MGNSAVLDGSLHKQGGAGARSQRALHKWVVTHVCRWSLATVIIVILWWDGMHDVRWAGDGTTETAAVVVLQVVTPPPELTVLPTWE